MSPSFVTLHLPVSEIAIHMYVLPEAVYVVYKNYIAYYNIYSYYCGVFIEMYVYTKFCLDWLLCEYVTFLVYIPIVMHGLRLFIVVLQELCCLPNFFICMIRVRGFYHFTKCGYFLVSEIGDCIT